MKTIVMAAVLAAACTPPAPYWSSNPIDAAPDAGWTSSITLDPDAAALWSSGGDLSGSDFYRPPTDLWSTAPCGDVTLQYAWPAGKKVTYNQGECEPCVRGCVEVAQDRDRHTHEDARDGGAFLDGIVACVTKCRKGTP
jgi:hypothetical protein